MNTRFTCRISKSQNDISKNSNKEKLKAKN